MLESIEEVHQELQHYSFSHPSVFRQSDIPIIQSWGREGVPGAIAERPPLGRSKTADHVRFGQITELVDDRTHAIRPVAVLAGTTRAGRVKNRSGQSVAEGRRAGELPALGNHAPPPSQLLNGQVINVRDEQGLTLVEHGVAPAAA